MHATILAALQSEELMREPDSPPLKLATPELAWCVPMQCEGPSVFKTGNGSYYLMASHLSGWAPNPPLLFHAATPNLGDAIWHQLQKPASGPDSNITFNSQSTFVFPLEFQDGTVLYIYMGDRWNFYTEKSVRRFGYWHSCKEILHCIG